MPDPAEPFGRRRSDPNGVGPFRFVYGTDFGSGSLAAGARATLDLRELVENGTAGYYVVLSEAGYDSLEVENRDVNNPVLVEVNEHWQFAVPANTISGIDQAGMYRVTVENEGATAIASGDLVIEIAKSPFGADDAARQRAAQPPIAAVIEKFTGLRTL